jgi:hypothetical protein
MEAFFHPKSIRASDNYVSEAIVLFQDRSSLRVTDVSSVVFRDFALWYVYYYVVQHRLPPPISAGVIEDIFGLLRERDDVSFEITLSNSLNLDRWGQSL